MEGKFLGVVGGGRGGMMGVVGIGIMDGSGRLGDENCGIIIIIITVAIVSITTTAIAITAAIPIPILKA